MHLMNGMLLPIERRMGMKVRTVTGSISKQNTTMAQLKQQFMSERRGSGCTPKTLRYYGQVWDKFLLFLSTLYPEKEVEALPIKCLAVQDIQAKYRLYIESGGCKEQTILSHMRGVRAVINYASSIGLSNAPKIKIKDIEPPIKVTYTDAELDLLCRKPNTDDFIAYRAWLITRFTMGTSCRAGSIAGIKVGDVDLDDSCVAVNIVKNRSPIILPLVASIANELREYIGMYRTSPDGKAMSKEPLFPTQFGDPLSANAVGRIFSEYCKSLGLEKTSIHLLRHTYAKKYITSGGDVLSLKVMLGHRSLKMVNYYARLYGNDVKGLVEEHALISQQRVKSGRVKIKKR